MEAELLNCSAVTNLEEPMKTMKTKDLLDLWLSIQKRTYFYHETAVSALFRYLVLSDGSREDKLTVATLRLLKLTVTHALELQDVLQEGLETTPSAR
jgi:PI-3-kinase-related kinase SMG-1